MRRERRQPTRAEWERAVALVTWEQELGKTGEAA
jgi:hypothetical protein